MAAIVRATLKAMTTASLVLGGLWLMSATQPAASADKPQRVAPAAVAEPGKAAEKAAVAKAREQAKLMHVIYSSTLEAMHQHFFRRERAVLPARALEDVFADVESETKVKAKWIAVNTKAMSIHHEPASAFEKQAARAIAAGKGEYERVEDGYYYRAGPIPLNSSCINCHTGFFTKTPQTQRFAGLVIRVPVSKK
jgi:Protein of unknown function (DUF3365)